MTDTFTLTTKPCPAEGCVNGTKVYAVRTYGGRWTGEEEIRDCETCGGNGSITVEVHEACGKDESGNDPCRCFESAEEIAA